MLHRVGGLMKKSGSGGVELGHFARRGSLLPSNTWCICCWGGGVIGRQWMHGYGL